MRAVVDMVVASGSAVAIMAIGLLVVPVYLHTLGVEAYGLVGFLALLQSVLSLLDLGLTPTISREIASAAAHGSFDRARPLFFALTRLYLLAGLALGAAIIATAGLIANYWLQPQALDTAVVERVIMLMGVIVAVRWPIAIYNGALVGGRQLSLSSLANLAAACLGSLGGVALVLIHPDIVALFAWYAVIGLVQLLGVRYLALRLVGRTDTAPDIKKAMAQVWRFSAGMGFIGLCGVTLSQLDRLLVSRFVSLEAFGIYTVATVAGRALYGFVTPMYNIVSPRFTAMYATKQTEQLRFAYRQWTTLFCAAFFPVTMLVAVAARPLVEIWTGNPVIALQVAPLVTLIAIGSAFHSVMYFPFALQVAAGDSRTPLLINIVLLVIYVPLLTLLVWRSGTYGAALSWLLLFIVYVPIGTWMTHRTLLPDIALPWVILDIGLPLGVTAGFAVIAELLLNALAERQAWVEIAVIGLLATAALTCNALIALARYGGMKSAWHKLRAQRISLRESR